MAVQFKPMTVAPSSAAAMFEAQRQQAMADALRERSLSSRVPRQNGPVAVQMGWGEGLAQLGEALLARRAQKKADSKLGAAIQQQTANRNRALAQFLSPESMPGSVPPAAPNQPPAQAENLPPETQPSALRQNQPRSYEQLLSDALAASEAGVPKEVIEPYLEANAPTEKIRTLRQGGFTDEQIGDAIRGSARKDSYIAPVTINGVAFDPFTHTPTMSAPDPTTGIQQFPGENGTFIPYQDPRFNQYRGATAGATKYAEEAATLQPELINARAGQAGAIQGAQQQNTVFTNQTVTGPDGRVITNMPVWGSDIPGVTPQMGPPGQQRPPQAPQQFGPQQPTQQPPQQPPRAPQFGADPRKADTDAFLTQKRMGDLSDQAQTAEKVIATLRQIKQFMDEGALGTSIIDRGQRKIHDWGFPSKSAANTKQIEQLGSMLQLARGSLGVGVSNYDAEVYSKAAGDFSSAQNAQDRQNAYERMIEAATNIMNKANQAMYQFRQTGNAAPFTIYTNEEAADMGVPPISQDVGTRTRSYYGR